MVIAFGALAFAAPARASTIVYTCGWDICAVQPDGSHRHKVTRDGRSDKVYEAPLLSRDGNLMVFTYGYRMYVADSRGRNRRRVAAPKACCGSFIEGLRSNAKEVFFAHGIFEGAFAHQRMCRIGLTRGSRPRCGEVLAGDRAYWAWGPAGSLVSVDGGDRHDICVTSLSGRCHRVLVRIEGPKTFFFQPAVSPDDRIFAMGVEQADQDSTTRVSLFDARTGRHIRDVTRGHDDYPPAWSPDGKWLVFRRDAVFAANGTEASICTVRVEGGKVRCPVREGRGLGEPSWGG